MTLYRKPSFQRTNMFERGRISVLQEELLYIQKKTFTKWINSFLSKAGMKVDDIFVDLTNGRKLLKLLELISGEKLAKPNKGRMRLHLIDNVNKSLNFLHTKVRLESIGAEDIVDGNPRLILGLIWTIILHFQIQEIEIDIKLNDKFSGKAFAKEALLLWAQQMTSGYAGVEIKDFGGSWRNGLGFNALIHAHRSDLVNYESLLSQRPIENLKQAFDIGSVELAIPLLLDAEDIDTARPDEKSILMYVASCYHACAKIVNEEKSKGQVAKADKMTGKEESRLDQKPIANQNQVCAKMNNIEKSDKKMTNTDANTDKTTGRQEWFLDKKPITNQNQACAKIEKVENEGESGKQMANADKMTCRQESFLDQKLIDNRNQACAKMENVENEKKSGKQMANADKMTCRQESFLDQKLIDNRNQACSKMENVENEKKSGKQMANADKMTCRQESFLDQKLIDNRNQACAKMENVENEKKSGKQMANADKMTCRQESFLDQKLIDNRNQACAKIEKVENEGESGKQMANADKTTCRQESFLDQKLIDNRNQACAKIEKVENEGESGKQMANADKTTCRQESFLDQKLIDNRNQACAKMKNEKSCYRVVKINEQMADAVKININYHP